MFERFLEISPAVELLFSAPGYIDFFESSVFDEFVAGIYDPMVPMKHYHVLSSHAKFECQEKCSMSASLNICAASNVHWTVA